MKAVEHISNLDEKMRSSLAKFRVRDALNALRSKHMFRDFAVKLAKQRAILDGHDSILEPNAYLSYIFEITREEFEEYLIERLKRQSTPK